MRVRTASLQTASRRPLRRQPAEAFLLARWLEINPRVLIPGRTNSRGRRRRQGQIYALIQQLLEKGMAVLFISSELPEIVGSL